MIFGTFLSLDYISSRKIVPEKQPIYLLLCWNASIGLEFLGLGKMRASCRHAIIVFASLGCCAQDGIEEDEFCCKQKNS